MGEPLTRKAVIDATRALIVQDGLQEVSLRRVGAALGVTAPALYAYVADKRDLLQAIAEQEFADLIERFRVVAAATDDPIERTRGYAHAYITHAIENTELFKTMFLFQPTLGAGTVSGSKVSGGGELAIADEAFTMPAEALVEAIDKGIMRPIDPVVASLTMWTTVHGVATVLLMGFDFPPGFVESLVDSVIDNAIRGLLAE